MVICTNCGTENQESSKFCYNCGAKLVIETGRRSTPNPNHRSTPNPIQRQSSKEGEFATGKKPVLASILSFVIPGVGQFYNGDSKKGAIMLVGSIVLALMTAGFSALPVCIYSAIDAYQVGNGKKRLGAW